MNEQVARNVVLVRAIETTDLKHEILSDDDRKYASRSAKELAQWQAADKKSAVTTDHFLEQRSEQVLKRLSERVPAFANFLKRRPALPSLSFSLPVLAFLAGAALDRIADPHRVDLLSAPLLLIIGWNLLVYLLMLAWLFVPKKSRRPRGQTWLDRMAVGNAALPRRLPSTLAAALTQFLAEWAQLSAPLTRARMARALHLAAAAFALGAIVSLYARGLLREYGAGWESTFLDARQVYEILSILFAPALYVFPLQGFSLADVQLLRFSPLSATSGGDRWVHLYGATLFLLVVLPRILFALFAHWRARRYRRNFPLDVEQPYFRKLHAHVGAAAPAVLRVLPYSFTVDEARDRGLSALALHLFGEQARVMLRPSAPYGEDPRESLHDAKLDDSGVTVTTVLFNLAATPEKENHGAFLDYLVQRTPRGVAVMVDESGLTERGGGQPGTDSRIAERAALWRQFCSFHHTTATIVNLLHPDKLPLDADAGLTVSTKP